MSRRPVIGITLDIAEDCEKYSYASFPWYALRRNYADCVIKAGGMPVIIPYIDEGIEQILDLLDGLIIPGGDSDIHPRFYAQEVAGARMPFGSNRCDFEFRFLKEALARDIPFFGICNGMQLLNVVLGGSLMQHIPDRVETHIIHEQPAPKHVTSHVVHINEDTILSGLCKSREVMVNSTHHQAIDKLGEGVIVSASAEDGIIEAIESTDHSFAIGVQWHPEYLNDNGVDFALFEAFVKVASFFKS